MRTWNSLWLQEWCCSQPTNSSLLDDDIPDDDGEPKFIWDGLYDKIKERGENPVDQVGISTGFHAYDKALEVLSDIEAAKVIVEKEKIKDYAEKALESVQPFEV